MCGIVGYISNQKLSLNDNLSIMDHRGPDANGQYYYQYKEQHVGLGHVRLSIIDLDSHSDQPFEYLNRYVMVFNGEIYNYIEIRKELLKNDYVFSTSSDSEVLIAAYDYYKENVFDYLDGMFAFCIYDKKENKLICARDHVGIKPLYYYYNQENQEFYFASELKSLFTFKEVPKKISKNAICEFLFNGWLYEPDTGFENIFKIMPGGYVEYDLNTFKLKNKIYFDVAKEEKTLDSLKEKNIEDLIDNSIDIQCRSDVPLGVFFSGGVDSTVIVSKIENTACLSAKYNEDDIKDSGDGNDYLYSKEVAKELNLDLTPIELEEDNFSIDTIKNIVKCSEEPIADFTYQISEKISFKAKEAGYTVMLSGMGADEIFGGYPRYKYVKYKKFFSLIAFFSQPFSKIIKKSKYLAKKVDRFNEFVKEKDFIFAYTSLIVGFSKQEVRNLIKDKNDIQLYHNKISTYLDKVKDKSDFKKAFYLDLYGFLTHNFIVTDKSSMQASIELRVPLINKFLLVKNFYEDDDKLIDFQTTKKQLKNILRKILPDKIIDRRKMGFNPPMDILINNFGKEKIVDIVSKGSLNKYINIDYILNLIEEHFKNKNNHTYKLWLILYLNYWIEENE